MDKRYYRSMEEAVGGPESQPAGQDNVDLLALLGQKEEMHASRRDFLKIFGFSVASAAVAAACEQPVRKAIPYLIKPEQIIPGKASYYASSFYDGNDYCPVLVKVRDGRPIKIEGNALSAITGGGTNARTQASVLSLYDTYRYRTPQKNGSTVSWEETDSEIMKRLQAVAETRKLIVLLTPTIISPTVKAIIEGFSETYPGTRHIQYDAVSYSAMLLANETVFGQRAIPSYRFDNANVIASFGADFLGTWLSPVEFTRQYVKNRKLDDGQERLSRHIQLESHMSLTGSNADHREVIDPLELPVLLANLYAIILKSVTGEVISTPNATLDMAPLAETLLQHKERSLVVTGANDIHCQVLVNGINFLLNNYGTTIDLSVPLFARQGIDAEMIWLTEKMEAGDIGALFCWDVNPVYDYPYSTKFTSWIRQCALSVSLANLSNETSAACEYICPDHHYLEAWGDAEFKKGYYSLAQPAIHPIFNTRGAAESLLRWTGSTMPFDQYLKNYWEARVWPLSGMKLTFYEFWVNSLRDGVFEVSSSATKISFNPSALAHAISEVKTPEDGYRILLYENIALGNGKPANNPWLQELPDPITRVTWDNYAMVSSRLASDLGLKQGDFISLGDGLNLPVLIQPGMHSTTIAAALGYGRKISGLVADGVGQNVYLLAAIENGTKQFVRTGITPVRVKGKYKLAATQTHHSMEGRPIVRETTLEKYLDNPSSGNEFHAWAKKHQVSLYNRMEYKGHHWGMAIDLNSCVGCGACVVACSAENNIPVVGRRQVLAAHEMHWIRIDRYYSGDSDNPEVVYQPIMCQHCDNAPCENVCPVAATNHSDEGLNQMAYNRCVGTRYCNNNCPYKVRRFNYFDYTGADAIPFNTIDPAGMTVDLKRLVLNPDVTVRSKGVIEKCSFCVQRIQDKKLEAKLDNRMLRDGEIAPACGQACPANAIVFGDTNDPESRISKLLKDERNYHLLEELHTLPSVGYLTKVRNK